MCGKYTADPTLLCTFIPEIHASLGECLSLVVPNSDEVARWAEGCPGDVEPAGAGQELVGILTLFQERDKALELLRVTRADVGSTALQVLGVLDTTHAAVDGLATEAGVDDDGAADGLAGGLQQQAATIDHVGHLLRRRNVGRVLAQVAELCQREVWG